MLKIYKLLYILFDRVSRMSSIISQYIYYHKLIEPCCFCNKSGMCLGFENNIFDCKECNGNGYNLK